MYYSNLKVRLLIKYSVKIPLKFKFVISVVVVVVEAAATAPKSGKHNLFINTFSMNR